MTSRIDGAYDEIAGLTGNRAEMERQRYLIIKAIRALKAVKEDSAIGDCLSDETTVAFNTAVERLEAVKSELWTIIERTDASIQKLTDLVQNGAFNE